MKYQIEALLTYLEDEYEITVEDIKKLPPADIGIFVSPYKTDNKTNKAKKALSGRVQNGARALK